MLDSQDMAGPWNGLHAVVVQLMVLHLQANVQVCQRLCISTAVGCRRIGMHSRPRNGASNHNQCHMNTLRTLFIWNCIVWPHYSKGGQQQDKIEQMRRGWQLCCVGCCVLAAHSGSGALEQSTHTLWQGRACAVSIQVQLLLTMSVLTWCQCTESSAGVCYFNNCCTHLQVLVHLWR